MLSIAVMMLAIAVMMLSIAVMMLSTLAYSTCEWQMPFQNIPV